MNKKSPNNALLTYNLPAAVKLRESADVETEPLRGEETEPREVFLLLV